MLCRRYTFRRRHAIRLFLLAFVAYLGYLSLATLGFFGGIRESTFVTEHPVFRIKENEHHPPPFEQDVEAHVVDFADHRISEKQQRDDSLKSWAIYDNMADYSKIMQNGANGKGMNIDGKDLNSEEKKM